tara:strand:+ start:2141 stop:2725 length:585 start_codon:yes stop_codon:yes gene_type:complete
MSLYVTRAIFSNQIKQENMECKQCGSKYVSNKWFKLCSGCNNKRLHGNEYGKTIEYKEKEIKPLKSSNNQPTNKRTIDKGKRVIFSGGGRSKSFQNILLDEIFYLRCFQGSDHKCEECNTKLPEEFRNEDGDLIYIARYSHVIPKSIAPELRHEVDNINHLCIECHQKWDFGGKKEMKIYTKNQLRFPNYLKPL